LKPAQGMREVVPDVEEKSHLYIRRDRLLDLPQERGRLFEVALLLQDFGLAHHDLHAERSTARKQPRTFEKFLCLIKLPLLSSQGSLQGEDKSLFEEPARRTLAELPELVCGSEGPLRCIKVATGAQGVAEVRPGQSSEFGTHALAALGKIGSDQRKLAECCRLCRILVAESLTLAAQEVADRPLRFRGSATERLRLFRVGQRLDSTPQRLGCSPFG